MPRTGQTPAVYVARVVDRPSQGFEVAPVPLGGGSGARRRRRRLPALVVLLVAIAVPVIAWVGPKIEVRPNLDLAFNAAPTASPTATPRRTPTPSSPLPTALPEITFAEGPRPTVPIAIDVGGVRILDPGTGELGPVTSVHVDRDAVFTAVDGWWCVCFSRGSFSNSETTTVTVQRIDAAGRLTSSVPVGEYTSATDSPDQDIYTRFDLELAPDGRTAYLASAVRSGRIWTVAVDTIDLKAGGILAHTELAKFDMDTLSDPKASPSPSSIQVYLSGPSIRLSPDGRRLLAWASLDAFSDSGGEAGSTPTAWLIDTTAAADGTVGAVMNMDAGFAASMRMCGWAAWSSEERFVTTCFSGQAGGSQVDVTFTEVGIDGGEIRHVQIAISNESWFTEPIFDRANMILYLWDPNGHLLHRIDFEHERADSLAVDRDSGTAVESPPDLPPLGRAPAWTPVSSDMRMWYSPQLVAEPGGSRLFAIGLTQQEAPSRNYVFKSSGIWVFDTSDFALADHWNPVTGYGSIGISRDGRWLTAAGMPQMDAEGRPTDWQASLTVIDTSDGRAALRLGRLGGPETSVMQVPP